jgi:mannose-6-phosphate isomerase-like protein (cupin superfamily)
MGTNRPARLIENPLSGERIVVPVAVESNCDVLAWDLYLSPGGKVPSAHLHPLQEERFRVVVGRVRFRVGWRRVVARAGDTVRVPAATAHHFANIGPGGAWLEVETSPPLRMVAMFEAAANMARQQQAEGRLLPRLVDLALFMREFEAEVGAPYFPGPVRFVARGVARLARITRRDGNYRRLCGDLRPELSVLPA